MTDTFDFIIHTKQDLIDVVNHFGFVPLFTNSIKGFSIEEHVAKEAWFSSSEGVWEWKGPVIQDTHCAYGKFFDKKAAFISEEWFLDFANYRRDGYDYDARFNDHLSSYSDNELYNLIAENSPVLSKRLKKLGNYGKDGKKGFDTSINRLMAQGYVIIDNFVYDIDKNGSQYGWGVGEYTTPEQFFGDSFIYHVYDRDPRESYDRIFQYFTELLPSASEEEIRKILQ